MNQLSKITAATKRIALVSEQPVALSPMAAHMALLKRSRAYVDCPECIEHDDGRECDLCGNKTWLWADHPAVRETGL